MNSQKEQELLKSSKEILLENVYPDNGYLWSPYRCISPGKTVFHGVWNWDSAFHAVGVSRWDTTLAKESILGFLQFQKKDGLLPDVIWEKGSIVDMYSKPPVFAWATEIVYKRDNDIEFLKEVYPKLVLNESFWANKRCFDGLFFYDSEQKDAEDYQTQVRYESGWDNSVRWDNGINELWAIDLNCFMVMFYRSMGFIAGELRLDDVKIWAKKENELSKLINERLWDGKNRCYCDVDRFTKKASYVLTPASFMPLYIQIASKEQAEAMRAIAENNFKCKMSTVSFDNPQYSNDYWRGPTWLNVAYFAAKGLKNYGFEVAEKIKESILEMCDKNKDGIYENYDSITGQGLCCNRFSWSCVFAMEFILNF